MNTHESYVSLKTDALLKQAGFDWWEKGLPEYSIFTVPTLAVAQRWLREEKGFLLSVELAENDYDALWYWSICRFCNNEGLTYVDWYGDQWLEAEEKFQKNEEQSYEQALEAGIQKCLTILLRE